MKITIEKIRKAIERDNSMLNISPNKSIIYFIHNKQRKERVKQNLANDLYYDFCHSKNAYDEFDIYKLIMDAEIPNDIIQFYVDTDNGGYYELGMIYFIYGIGNSEFDNISELKEEMLNHYGIIEKSKINKLFQNTFTYV